MSFKKILLHPDRGLIIRQLADGMGVRKVEELLKDLHPDDKDLHITKETLQKFRKEHMRLDKEAIEKIRGEIKKKDEKKIVTQIKQLPAYKQKLKEAVEVHIDIRQELRDMFVLLKARLEDIFNSLQRGEATTIDEQNLQKYFQVWITAIEKHAKYIDKIADHTVETTNVNITIIEDQMMVLREAVRETMMEEMSPEGQVRFLEKLDKKMKDLSYRRDKPQSIQKIHKDVKVLATKAGKIDD